MSRNLSFLIVRIPISCSSSFIHRVKNVEVDFAFASDGEGGLSLSLQLQARFLSFLFAFLPS